MDFLEIVVDRRIDMELDDLEEAISEAFSGMGEVAENNEGAGLELQLDRDLPEDDVLERFFAVVDDLGIGDAVKARTAEDEEWLRLSDWQG